MNIARHIETPVEGMGLLQDYLLDRPAATPTDIKDRLRELVRPGTSPVVSSVEAAELIYARRDELAPELLEIGAQLAAMCALYNFHGMAEEGRGQGMAATIRSMDAVSSQAPVAAISAPEPRADLLPAPEGDSAPTGTGELTGGGTGGDAGNEAP